MNTIENVLQYYNSFTFSNLAQKAYEILLEMIITRVITADKTYSESELCDLLDIGRSPVRDALKRLEFDSLIKTIPRAGIMIVDLRLEDFQLQLEVRRPLEKIIISRASKLAGPSDRKKLKQFNTEHAKIISQNDDIAASLRLDNKIHALISESAKNPYAARALRPFQILEQMMYFQQYYTQPVIISQINKEHIAFVDKIVDGDPDTACQHFDNMITNAEALIKQQLHL